MWLAENDCANVPRDVEYPVVLCGLGRMSYRVCPPEPVLLSIYERLLPFRGIFNWSGPSMTDANDIGLAQTAAALGRPDDADHFFTSGIELCERMPAPRATWPVTGTTGPVRLPVAATARPPVSRARSRLRSPKNST